MRRRSRAALASSCSRCGARLYEDAYVYSRHTQRRYCADFNACDRRARRNEKRGESS